MNTYIVEFRCRKTGLLELTIKVTSQNCTGVVSLARIQALGEGFKFDRVKHVIGIAENNT